ncbi:MAG: FecR family protein [Flavobacteriaceae bacterium]|nr:FecR family protein [Flavobacteriaceae bacterium]
MNPELLLKYLNNEASEKEVTLIFEWIDASEENKKQFIELKKAWVLTASLSNQKVSSWSTIKKQTIRRKRFDLLKYAAILIIVFGIGRIIYLGQKTSIPTANEVVLELGNGSIKHLNQTQQEIIVDNKGNILGKQQANEIIYQANASSKEITYNTLKIPYGKTFKLTLSDGTVVHLNAGTVFKFPEQFVESTNREVYLTGEAFFEVTKNTKQPFIVHSNKINIEVLGTVFNVSAYEDDAYTHCELLEGSVRLSEDSNTSNQIILSPNFKGTWNESLKTFETKKVDVNEYIAWVKGELIFNDAYFSTIAKKLERSFNINITNLNDSLANQHFTGAIKIKDADIKSLFDLFKIDTPFEYSINQNKIEIKKAN